MQTEEGGGRVLPSLGIRHELRGEEHGKGLGVP